MPDRYVCAHCGTPATPLPGFTALTADVVLGNCPKCKTQHPRQLIREGAHFTPRPKPKRSKQGKLPL